MAVKILIKRKYKEENADALGMLLKNLRALTVSQKGYISGETYKRFDEDGQSLVISTWQTVDDWRRWFHDEDRIEIQNQIDLLTDEPTDYEIYVTP